MTKFFRDFLLVFLAITEKSQVTSIEIDVKSIANRYERSVVTSLPSASASNASSTGSASFDHYLAPTEFPLLLTSAPSSRTKEGRSEEETDKSKQGANKNRWSRETIIRRFDSDSGLFSAKTIKKRNIRTETKDEKSSRAKNFVRMFKTIYDPKKSSSAQSRWSDCRSISCLSEDHFERGNRQEQMDSPEKISESDGTWQEALGLVMSSSNPQVLLRKNTKTFRFGKRKPTERVSSSSINGDPFSIEGLLKSKDPRDDDDGLDIRLFLEQDSDLAERLRNLSPKKIRKFRYGKRQRP